MQIVVKCKQKLGDATESINVSVAHGVNRQLQWTKNITYNAIIVILYVYNIYIYIILNTLLIFIMLFIV